jgi:hypothetical protein
VKESSNFVKLHCITTLPGNPIRIQFVRASRIEAFGPPAEEYAKIGAAGHIDLSGSGDRMYVSENEDEIFALLSEIEND